MEEVIIKAFNYGFAAVMCLLMFFKLLPKIDEMNKTVTKDSENTAKVEVTMNGLKNVIENHLVHSIDKLATEVSNLNGKKQ